MMRRIAACVASSVLAVQLHGASANEASSASGAAVISWKQHDVTPIGKVVELLDVLKTQVEKDGEADGAAYNKYTSWYAEASVEAKRVITETSDSIETLQSGIAEQEALRQSAQQQYEKVANALAKEEKELKTATEQRTKERATFEDAEGVLMDGVDSLERGLLVLGKSMPSGSSAASASLLSVAQKLKKTLLQGNDFQLTGMQRKTLEGFLRAAARAPEQPEDEESQSLAPDFLQVRMKSKQAGPYGEYESQTGGAVATLQSVLDKTSKELEETRKTEETARTNFKQYDKATKRNIENKEKTLSEVKMEISHSQQLSSQMEAQLKQNQELLKVTKEDVDKMKAEFETKTNGYKERCQSRTDEVMAVREAAQLLTSDTAQRILAAEEAGPASFVQVSQKRKHANRLLKMAESPGVALLAIKSHARAGLSRRADPFGKVKSMIGQMLRKLQEQAAQEQKHHEWCSSEMEKSTKSQSSKQEAIQKITDRIGAMDAELEQLTSDIKTTQEEMADMKKATAEAQKVREQETAQAAAAIQQYKDAEALVGTAIGVLKKFYDKAAKAAAGSAKGRNIDAPAKAKAGMSSGVIGILEIAKQDFADLLAEAQQNEAVSAQQYKEMMNESEIRMAVFTKDLEYRSRNKVKLAGDRMRANNDLKSLNLELEAVNSYLDKLKEECIAKPEPYEERKARREKELDSLNEALQFLKGEALA
eukprot:TRINITY_DN9459_c0_g1_i1.p1 TRINITY_DN9459_c0_g1~~TRINITY_DN9459_c0_g1_i1.p1  ORF type:complete len:708 (+),score=238.13 TRINITY_DN9459_c0_g1_i1:75-2198(+)